MISDQGIKYLVFEDCVDDSSDALKRFNGVKKTIERVDPEIYFSLQPRT
jgi:alpha-galactosidase